MSARKKIFLVLIASLTLLLAVQYLVHRILIFPSYAALERADARRQLDRVIEAIGRETVHLDTTAHDWGSWDDTAAYMASGDETFIETNLGPTVFIDNRLDFVQLVDTGGRVVWQSAVERSSGEKTALRGLPGNRYPSDHILVSHPSGAAPLGKRSLRGIMILDGRPALIASRPILTSENTGPIRGTIILGRHLDDHYVQALEEMTRVLFEIAVFSESASGSGKRGTGYEGTTIEPTGDGELAARTLLADIAGHPAVEVVAYHPRRITAQGWRTILFSLAVTAAACLVLFLVLRAAVWMILLRPLSALTRDVERVYTEDDYRPDLPVNRGDEIGTLAGAFRKMIHHIDNQTDALKKQADRDALTGLANRRSLLATLKEEWRRMAREQHPLSVIMSDVDRFKAYNDTYGHAAGDECLKAVAAVLDANTRRAGDLAARYGGEEFLVVLPGTPLQAATQIAERIRAEIAGLDIAHESSDIAAHLTISLGVATAVPDTRDSFDTLLKAADDALYAAKGAGRNRVATAKDR